MTEKLFTAEFLDEVQKKDAAQVDLVEYTNGIGLSFHDAILKIAEKHGMIPEYVYPGYRPPEYNKKFIERLLEDYWDASKVL